MLKYEIIINKNNAYLPLFVVVRINVKRRTCRMSKEKKTINDAAIQELSLDELEDIAGGKITAGGYLVLSSAVLVAKRMGKTKDSLIEVITESWETGSKFKDRCTDGMDMDLTNAISYINQIW
jgi:hypothetical protein